MRSSRSIGVPVVVALALPSVLLLPVPGPALGARLAGGRTQAAVRRAFDASAVHRRQLIASIRVSTVDPAWSLVRSLLPQSPGRAGSAAGSVRLTNAYYRRSAGAERPGSPPAAVRADLGRPLRVAVVYTASGAEAITYSQAYRSDCAGSGDFTESETIDVRPMSWTVRYIVNLDDILAATRGALGSALVPAVTFAAAGSRMTAVEDLEHAFGDAGCNGPTTTFRCAKAFHLGGADPAGQLSTAPDGGLDIGLPLASKSTGACAAEDFVLGPSLWEEGAARAVAAHLGLFGGSLPADPYAPVRVSWPGNSDQPFLSSPCLGDVVAVCRDSFAWSGTVRLVPVP